MKKNPLEEIYSSQILLNEEKDSVVVPAGKQEIAKGGKVSLAPHYGPDKVKDVEDPEEAEGTDVNAATPKVLEDSVEEAPKKSFEGSFEKLFKATINEQFPGEEEVDAVEMDIEVPTSNEDMVDELEGKEDEVSDLVSDLKAVMDHLQNILDKISDETASEQETEDEMEFGDEEGSEETEEETEEEAVGEAVELKTVPDSAGKKLQSKNNKAGSIKPHGGKAHGGNVESDSDLKPAKPFNKALQSPRGRAEVGNIKKGEFFK